DVHHAARTHSNFHFFGSELSRGAVRKTDQQRVLILRADQVLEELRMKEDVGVQHDERIGEEVTRKPQRKQTVCLGVMRVFDVAEIGPTSLSHACRAKADNDCDLIDALRSECADLSPDERNAAHRSKTLWQMTRHASQSRSSSRSQDDCFFYRQVLTSCTAAARGRFNSCLTLLSYHLR